MGSIRPAGSASVLSRLELGEQVVHGVRLSAHHHPPYVRRLRDVLERVLPRNARSAYMPGAIRPSSSSRNSPVTRVAELSTSCGVRPYFTKPAVHVRVDRGVVDRRVGDGDDATAAADHRGALGDLHSQFCSLTVWSGRLGGLHRRQHPRVLPGGTQRLDPAGPPPARCRRGTASRGRTASGPVSRRRR